MSAALQRPRSVGQFVRGIFLDDLRNKGTAVLLALMIWYVAFSNTEGTETLTLIVKISPPGDAIIVDSHVAGTEFKNEVTLTIRGQRRILEQIQESKKDYSGAFLVEGLGKREVKLARRDRYRFPTGVKVLNADPPAVDVDVEAKERRDVHVQPQAVTGDPLLPYRYDPLNVTVTPAKVTIIGASSHVDRVGVVLTDPIDLNGLEGPRIVVVRNLRAPSQEFVELDPEGVQQVEIVLILEVAVEERDLKVPMRFSILPDHRVSATLVPPDFKVTFVGPPEALVALDEGIRKGRVWGTIRVSDRVQASEPASTVLQPDDVRFLEGMLPAGVVVEDLKPAGVELNTTMERQK